MPWQRRCGATDTDVQVAHDDEQSAREVLENDAATSTSDSQGLDELGSILRRFVARRCLGFEL
jgi:hypothetical protein